MFDSIGNMPLHPLVIHAVVIGAPLAVLLAFLFAVPRTRRWARWALPITAVGAAAAGFVAKESGESLQRTLQITPATPTVGPLIEQHSELADQLFILLVALAVLAVLSTIVVSRPAAGSVRTAGRPVDRVLITALVLVAVAVGVWTYRVGDIGARAVWNPTGTATF